MLDPCLLPTAKSADRKGLGTCDALLCVTHTLQSALEMGQEVRMVQIDFSAAFDKVSHQGILFKLSYIIIIIIIVLLLFVFEEVVVAGQTFRSISNQAGLQLSE